ncbi:MAG: hypothetical protein D6674_07490 [Acidobacteria bacterium]|nr:MAG: hypothetical protein D6674_07490 [Acidobacteriota bacterium]
MTDFFVNLLRVFVVLGIVIVLILITLPYILPLLQRFSISAGGKEGIVKLKRIIPIGKGAYIVELEIKGKSYVLALTEGGVDVVYRDEDVNS